MAQRRLPGVDEVAFGNVAVDEQLGRSALFLAQAFAQLLDPQRAACIDLGFPERANKLEQRDRTGLGMADHAQERRWIGRSQHRRRHVHGLGRLEHREVAVVDALGSGVVRPGDRIGALAVAQDLDRLQVQDAPRHVDQAAGDREVDFAVLPDPVQVGLRELHEVDLPRVELLVHDELEEKGGRLLERVRDNEMDPFLQALDERRGTVRGSPRCRSLRRAGTGGIRDSGAPSPRPRARRPEGLRAPGPPRG